MDPMQLVPPKSPSDWRFNHVVLETIFENLDLSDLKSASLVCQQWSTSSAKAFGAISRAVVPDPGHGGASNLRSALQRFRLQKEMVLELNSGSKGLWSAFSEFPVGTLMTHLIISYEPTLELVAEINELLRNLVGGFGCLKQLELRPEVNSDNGQEVPEENIESSDWRGGVHRALQVLVVNVGHLSSSGLDWGFLKSLVNLEELHLLGINCSKILVELLSKLASNFKRNLNKRLKLVFKLNARQDDGLLRPTAQGDQALQHLFKAIKPDICQFVIFGENGFYGVSHDVFDLAKAARSAAVDADLQIDIQLEKVPQTEICFLGFVMAYYRYKASKRVSIALRVRIELENCASFIEFRNGDWTEPLYVRHGPQGGQAQVFKEAAALFIFGLRHDTIPKPDWDVLRRFTFARVDQAPTKLQMFVPISLTEEEAVNLDGADSCWSWSEVEFVDAGFSLDSVIDLAADDPPFGSVRVSSRNQYVVDVYSCL